MVKQTIPPRAERNDTIGINASGGNGIRTVGYIVRDAGGNGPELWRDSTALAGTDANVLVRMRLNLPASMQGKTVGVMSWATDASGRTGYSVGATANVPVTVHASSGSRPGSRQPAPHQTPTPTTGMPEQPASTYWPVAR